LLVGIYSHHQKITQRARTRQIPNVTNMQKIKATVGQYDPGALMPRDCDSSQQSQTVQYPTVRRNAQGVQ
jgi:hypothetical protein